MAQHDYVIANGTGAAVRSDLNNGLAAIVSQNSGATAPATTYAYMTWPDTTAGVMKMRNGANNAWITLYQLDGEWSTIAFENGTAAAPSIYFKDSGTDTGIYNPGTDQVAISTGGTGRLFVSSAGLVGIGTSSPSQLLTVTGGNALINGITVGRAPTGGNTTNIGAGNLGSNTGDDNQAFGISVLSANTTGVQNVGVGYTTLVTNSIGSYNTAVGVTALRFGTGSNNTGLGWNAGANNTGSTCTYLGYNAGASTTSGSNNTIIGSIAGTAGLSDTVIIGAGTTERLRIDSSGRVGIGTSTFADNNALLHVSKDASGSTGGSIVIRNGAANASGNMAELVFKTSAGFSNGFNSAKIAAIQSSASETADLAFYTYGSGTGTERARIDSSGRLLVGTSSAATTDNNANSPNIQLEGADGDASRLLVRSNTGTDATRGPIIYLSRSRGTTANSKTSVVADDFLGSLIFEGTDGTADRRAASINAFVDGTPGTNDMPGRLVFSTTADGAASPTERFRISSDGSFSSVIPGGSTLYPRFGCRAWVNFNGTGTVAIRGSGNVSSITDNGTGNYTVNFTTAMPDANYSVVMSNKPADNNTSQLDLNSPYGIGTANVSMKCSNTSGAAADSVLNFVAIFR